MSSYITDEDIDRIMSAIPKTLTHVDIQGLVVTLILSYIEDLDQAKEVLQVVTDNLEVVAESRSSIDKLERTLH